MPCSLALPTTPSQIVPSLLAHLNSLDTQTMLKFYTPDATIVSRDGTTHHGHAAIGRELEKYFSFGLPMEITPRSVLVAGDTALLILDWWYKGTAKNGEEVDFGGTSTDVARLGSDGCWRYVLDCPFGVEVRQVSVNQG